MTGVVVACGALVLRRVDLSESATENCMEGCRGPVRWAVGEDCAAGRAGAGGR